MTLKMLKIITNSWFIATLLGVIVYLLIPFHPYPVKFHLVGHDINQIMSNCKTYFRDLNSDETTEKVFLYKNVKEETSLQIKGAKKGIKEQYNLSTEYYEPNNTCSFGDYDHDGFEEVYVFSKRGDSVFLSWVEPFDPIDSSLKQKFYCKIDERGGSYYLAARNAVVEDVNGDGFGELVIGIHTGYNLQPRVLTVFDIHNDSLMISKSIGISLNMPLIGDFNGDRDIDITGSTYASGNISDTSSIVYKDQQAWLILYDNDLEIQNKPVAFGGQFTQINIIKSIKKSSQVIGITWSLSLDDMDAVVFKYDFAESRYEEIDRIVLSENEVQFWIDTISDAKGSYYYVANTLGEVRFYDENYRFEYEFELNFRAYPRPMSWDSPKYGKLLVWSGYRSPIARITDTKGVLFDLIEIPSEKLNPLEIFTVYPEVNEPLLALKTGPEIFFFKETVNAFYYIKYLVLIAMVLAFFGFIKIIQRLHLMRIQLSTRLKDEMIELQLQSIKNQLDPHFTFNALNVLNYLSAEKDLEGVGKFTSHFSKLMRKQMEISDKASITLFDELRFISDYIALQKLRFEKEIDYQEDIEHNVDLSLMIPKMMIHCHVDNAIKHGLMPKGGGRIILRLKFEKGITTIEIEDNGVGRDSITTVSHQNDRNGKGLVMLDQLYDLFYQLNKVRIYQEIIDLYDKNNHPRGTLVRISI